MPGRAITERVFKAPLIDTHEHLIEEKDRLQGAASRASCDDWALLFSHYLNSDLLVAGMPKADMDRFLSPKVDPAAKWKLSRPTGRRSRTPATPRPSAFATASSTAWRNFGRNHRQGPGRL